MEQQSKTVITVCYGKIKPWSDRKKAETFFLQAMASSEGSEQSRYTQIYMKLLEGKVICTDGCDFKLTCLNCGHLFFGTVEIDELGIHSSCPECSGSFDCEVTDYE